MRKSFEAIVAVALIASMLGGCRGSNVSNDSNGMITDPTSTSTAATMPSTDTAPLPSTNPTTATDSSSTTEGESGTNGSANGNGSDNNSGGSTGESGANGNTENGATQGKARHAKPRSTDRMN